MKIKKFKKKGKFKMKKQMTIIKNLSNQKKIQKIIKKKLINNLPLSKSKYKMRIHLKIFGKKCQKISKKKIKWKIHNSQLYKKLLQILKKILKKILEN